MKKAILLASALSFLLANNVGVSRIGHHLFRDTNAGAECLTKEGEAKSGFILCTQIGKMEQILKENGSANIQDMKNKARNENIFEFINMPTFQEGITFVKNTKNKRTALNLTKVVVIDFDNPSANTIEAYNKCLSTNEKVEDYKGALYCMIGKNIRNIHEFSAEKWKQEFFTLYGQEVSILAKDMILKLYAIGKMPLEKVEEIFNKNVKEEISQIYLNSTKKEQ